MTMMTTPTLRRVTIAAVLALGLVGSAAAATTSTERVVKVERVKLGQVLFSMKGYALYTYGADTKNHSKCFGTCLKAWPALTVAKGKQPTGYSGLGFFVRSNGVHQVTWRGRPLYRFISDARGAVTGNGVAGFHAAVVKAASSTTTSTTTKSYGY